MSRNGNASSIVTPAARGSRKVCVLTLVFASAALCLPGCLPTESVSLKSHDPVKRMEAMVDAAEDQDRSKIPGLVKLLDSDDPATRMIAIRTLENITGETHGFDHAAPRRSRDIAVDRWVQAVQSGKYGQLDPEPRSQRALRGRGS